MIPHEIAFYRAETLEELVSAWKEAAAAGRVPAYYGGGSELLTLARDNRSSADAMIDYKRIAEAQVWGTDALPEMAAAAGSTQRVFGAALRLNTIVDAAGSGLFARCAGGVADRTVRNTITLGGNICGMLAYREAVLPFLLLDGYVLSVGPETDGLLVDPLERVFSKRLVLSPGAAAVAFSVGEAELAGLGLLESGAGAGDDAVHAGYGAVTATGRGTSGGWFYRRRTRDARLDYPLVTLALAILNGSWRVAVSGAWGYPVRAHGSEDLLNGEDAVARARSAGPAALRELCAAAVDAQGLRFRDDMRGSAEYRRELTIQALEEGLRTLGDVTA